MGEITVKIHDVFHDKSQFSSQKLENFIESRIQEVSNVRIASGDTNSPIFVTFTDIRGLSLQSIQRYCLRVVERFSESVPGVSIDQATAESNILIKSS